MIVTICASRARFGLSAVLLLALAAGTTAQTTQQPAGQTTPAAGTTTTTTTRTASKPGTFTSGGAKTEAQPAQPAQQSPAPVAQSPAPAAPSAPPAVDLNSLVSSSAMPPSGPSQRMDSLPAENAAMFPEDVPVYSDPQAEGDAAATGGPNVSVSEYLTVDMFVQDEDLANVLQMLSLQSRRNIVASKDVSARVTANLYGVTFFEALDSILHVNGYGYIERGNFIYVYSLEEINQIKAEDRQLISRVIHLNYLNANDAAEFVSPLLSTKGQIKTNGDVGSFQIPEESPTGDEQFALAATLVVFDYPENLTEIEKLLSNLDTKPAQVLVEATILQTQLTEANAFGVDFAFLNGVNFLDFFDIGGPLSAANNLNQGANFAPADNQGTAIVGVPGNTGGRGTFKLSIIDDDISVFIRALDEVSDVSVVSNPKILALNRQSARVSIGRKIGYLKSTTNNGVTEQDVDFLPTGTSLAFRPFISKDGMIRLELKPKVSQGIINEFTDNEGRTVTVPDEISQEVTTNVVVPDGSTVVLGGLFREETSLARSQIPVIGDIPIIGAAFRGHDDTTDRFEVIFMIKPTIVNDKILLSQGETAVAYAERVRTGSRQGLLPWSRDRQTTQLNVRAEKLAAEGETDQARYALRRSLELNPSQPDVYRMNESIGGNRISNPSRSILDRIVNEAANEKSVSFSPSAPTESLPSAPATSDLPQHSEPAASSEAPSSSEELAGFMPFDLSNDSADSAPDFSSQQWFFGEPYFIMGSNPTMPFNSFWTYSAFRQMHYMACTGQFSSNLAGAPIEE